MEHKYVVTDPESLRKICIDHNWFTCGSTEQYNKLFELNRRCEEEYGSGAATLSDIALVIWLCSDGIPKQDIDNVLTQEFWNRESEIRRMAGNAKYKLRLYHIRGANKGNLHSEEYFTTFEETITRYHQLTEKLGQRFRCFRPTVWDMETGERIEGY